MHLAQGLSAVGQESGCVPQAYLGQPLAQFQKTSGLAVVYLLKGTWHQLQAGLDLAPTAVDKGAGHGKESLPFPAHRRQHVSSQYQAFPRHIVGLVGEGFYQRGEHLNVPEGQVAHQVRTDFKELGSQSAGLPGTLVEAPAQPCPAGDVLRAQVGHDSRTGLEKRHRQGRRVLGQIGPAAGPLHERRE